MRNRLRASSLSFSSDFVRAVQASASVERGHFRVSRESLYGLRKKKRLLVVYMRNANTNIFENGD